MASQNRAKARTDVTRTGFTRRTILKIGRARCPSPCRPTDDISPAPMAIFCRTETLSSSLVTWCCGLFSAVPGVSVSVIWLKLRKKPNNRRDRGESIKDRESKARVFRTTIVRFCLPVPQARSPERSRRAKPATGKSSRPLTSASHKNNPPYPISLSGVSLTKNQRGLALLVFLQKLTHSPVARSKNQPGSPFLPESKSNHSQALRLSLYAKEKTAGSTQSQPKSK